MRQAVKDTPTEMMPASRDALGTVPMDGRDHVVRASLGELNLDNLSEEVERVGGHAVWWGVLAARARGEAARAKRRIKVVEGQRAKQHRIELDRANAKVTDAIIKELVATDAECERAEQEAIDAQERADIAAAAHEGVREKQRLVTSLTGALARELQASHGNMLKQLMRENSGVFKQR